MSYVEGAELKVLGSLIAIGNAKNETAQKILLNVTGDCFDTIAARNIYDEIQKQYRNHKPFDTLAIMDCIVNYDQQTYFYFKKLHTEYPYVSSVVDYEIDRLIISRDLKEQTRLMSQTMNTLNTETDCKEARQALTDGLNQVLNVNSYVKSDGETYEQIADDYFSGKHEQLTAVPTGIQEMDTALEGGILNKSLVTIAAGAGVGKTNLAIFLMNGLIQNVPDKQALFFSLEMENKVIWERHASIIARKRFNKLNKEEQNTTVAQLLKHDVKLFDSSRPDIDYIETTSKLAAMNKPVSVIVVDYLGLVQNKQPFERNDLKQEDVAKRLAALAKELNCIVIALSQINRKNAERSKDDRCPYPHDAADSSGSHRSSTLWIGADRPEIYNDDPTYKDMFVLKCRKNRFGNLFDIKLGFQNGLFKEVHSGYFRPPMQPKDKPMF